MAKLNIDTKNYPHLDNLIKTDPKKAQEIMKVFIELIDESIEHNWHELPQLFGRDELSFAALIKGILHGSLNLPDINPEAYDAIKEEVHPLSMIGIRKDPMTGKICNYNWREHFKLPHTAPVNQETIAEIFRKLLRYYKYFDVEKLAKAVWSNQVMTFQSMNECERLPFFPALRYQKEHFGDLHVGLFFTDVGAFDCGEYIHKYDGEYYQCIACQGEDEMWEVHDKLICPRCNAGFIKPE
jgi:hypothetical protein